MKYITTTVALLLSIGVLVLLNRPLTLGETSIPPLGPLLNPFSGFAGNAVSAQNYSNANMDPKGLKNEVMIWMDEDLIPHIKAENIQDLYYAQGYVHAKHRLWQMDFTYRAVAGRISEIIGPKAVNYDVERRLQGLDYATEQRLAAWQSDPEFNALLQAYTDGINLYINNLKRKDYPIEFKLIGYKPEAWSMEKSAYVFMGMCDDLVHGDDDIEMSNLQSVLGDTLVEFLFPNYYTKQRPIVEIEGPLQPVQDGKIINPKIIDQSIGHIHREKKPKNIGSNNWAIGPERSASGNPLLASDPHLSLRLPSIWFENQLTTPNMNAYGVSVPGLPSVVIGFNENVAWAMTNLGHDLRDWYTVDWADENKEEYFYLGERRKVEKRKSKIRVKGGADTSVTIKYTEVGPVWPNSKGKDYTFRWLLFDETKNQDLAFYRDINEAKDYTDYKKATKSFYFPPQNVVFASNEGDIALRVQGKVPIKKPGKGKYLQTLESIDNQWLGHIPHDQLPEIVNPERDFVFSANQHSTSPNYPYFYGGSFEGFRSREIYDRLSERGNWTLDDVKKLQLNVHNLRACDVKSTFVEALSPNSLNEQQLNFLQRVRNWNCDYSPDSDVSTLFHLWIKEVENLTYDEIRAYEDSMDVIIPHDWRTTELVLNHPNHQIFDITSTPETEYVSDVIRLAFEAAWEAFDTLETDQKLWANFKNVSATHMARLKSFSRSGLQVGGYGETINATTSTHGPSWRMVVELDKPVKAYGIYPGGQDGNPGSPYYDRFLSDWETGQYRELNFITDWELDPTDFLYFIKFNPKK